MREPERAAALETCGSSLHPVIPKTHGAMFCIILEGLRLGVFLPHRASFSASSTLAASGIHVATIASCACEAEGKRLLELDGREAMRRKPKGTAEMADGGSRLGKREGEGAVEGEWVEEGRIRGKKKKR